MVKALLVMSLGGHLLLRSIDYFLCGKYPRRQYGLDKNIKSLFCPIREAKFTKFSKHFSNLKSTGDMSFIKFIF